MPVGTLITRSRGSKTVFIVAIIAVVSFVAAFWYSTSTRISAIEARLTELAETRVHRLPEQNWRYELERASRDMEARTNARLADLETSIQALKTAPETVDTSRRSTGPAEGTVARSRVEPRAETPKFEEGLQSLYRSLALTPERRAELGTGIEELLGSIWVEYVELSKSPGADTTALQQRYCDRAYAILTPEEAQRLGC